MKRLTLILMLVACDEPMPPPPPVGPSTHELPTIEPTTGEPDPCTSTGEPDPCPWSGMCADLEPIDECDSWGLACGDGWRCIDTVAAAGIVCVDEDSSSSGQETT